MVENEWKPELNVLSNVILRFETGDSPASSYRASETFRNCDPCIVTGGMNPFYGMITLYYIYI